MQSTLPPGALRALGKKLASVLTEGALEHADLPPIKEISFDQEARARLAAIERKTAPAPTPQHRAEDPA